MGSHVVVACSHSYGFGICVYVRMCCMGCMRLYTGYLDRRDLAGRAVHHLTEPIDTESS